jgi:hypothetical protein
MKSISAAKHSSVVSLLNEGYSHRQVQARTGLGKGTIGRISQEVVGDKENPPGGHPSKLSPRDKQSIIRQISSGRLDNAVQATRCKHWGSFLSHCTFCTECNRPRESRLQMQIHITQGIPTCIVQRPMAFKFP